MMVVNAHKLSHSKCKIIRHPKGEKYFVLYHFTLFSNMVACYQEGQQKKACFPKNRVLFYGSSSTYY